MNKLEKVIPQPILLNSKIINYKYNNKKYCTSDFSGEATSNLLVENGKVNIPKINPKYFYTPAIGELGLGFQFIQIVNDTITSYKGDIVNLEKKYASTTLHTDSPYIQSEPVEREDLQVWNYDANFGCISYNNVHNKYSSLKFYKYIPGQQNFLEGNIDNEGEDLTLKGFSLDKYSIDWSHEDGNYEDNPLYTEEGYKPVEINIIFDPSNTNETDLSITIPSDIENSVKVTYDKQNSKLIVTLIENIDFDTKAITIKSTIHSNIYQAFNVKCKVGTAYIPEPEEEFSFTNDFKFVMVQNLSQVEESISSFSDISNSPENVLFDLTELTSFNNNIIPLYSTKSKALTRENSIEKNSGNIKLFVPLTVALKRGNKLISNTSTVKVYSRFKCGKSNSYGSWDEVGQALQPTGKDYILYTIIWGQLDIYGDPQWDYYSLSIKNRIIYLQIKVVNELGVEKISNEYKCKVWDFLVCSNNLSLHPNSPNDSNKYLEYCTPPGKRIDTSNGLILDDSTKQINGIYDLTPYETSLYYNITINKFTSLMIIESQKYNLVRSSDMTQVGIEFSRQLYPTLRIDPNEYLSDYQGYFNYIIMSDDSNNKYELSTYRTTSSYLDDYSFDLEGDLWYTISRVYYDIDNYGMYVNQPGYYIIHPFERSLETDKYNYTIKNIQFGGIRQLLYLYNHSYFRGISIEDIKTKIRRCSIHIFIWNNSKSSIQVELYDKTRSISDTNDKIIRSMTSNEILYLQIMNTSLNSGQTIGTIQLLNSDNYSMIVYDSFTKKPYELFNKHFTEQNPFTPENLNKLNQEDANSVMTVSSGYSSISTSTSEQLLIYQISDKDTTPSTNTITFNFDFYYEYLGNVTVNTPPEVTIFVKVWDDTKQTYNESIVLENTEWEDDLGGGYSGRILTRTLDNGNLTVDLDKNPYMMLELMYVEYSKGQYTYQHDDIEFDVYVEDANLQKSNYLDLVKLNNLCPGEAIKVKLRLPAIENNDNLYFYGSETPIGNGYDDEFNIINRSSFNINITLYSNVSGTLNVTKLYLTTSNGSYINYGGGEVFATLGSSQTINKTVSGSYYGQKISSGYINGYVGNSSNTRSYAVISSDNTLSENCNILVYIQDSYPNS